MQQPQFKRLEFILSTMSLSIGLGNVWRFPYLVFKNGGAIFLFVYFIFLIVLGIPIFLLETSIGQFSRVNTINIYGAMVPLFEGVGYGAMFLLSVIGFFYNLVITYCVYYFIVSIRAELPWTKCNGEPDCFRANMSLDCESQLAPFKEKNITSLRSPSEIFFYDKVLQLSSGIDNLGGLDYPLPLCFLLAWLIIFFGLFKGIEWLKKIVYFTTLFPYLVITILVIMGALLKGSGYGIEYYITKLDFNKLTEPQLWRDAAVQVFFSISACCGALIIMANFNNFKNNIIMDSFIVPIMDCFTGFYAGFAIFAMFGHMYLSKCVETFEEVTSQGPELLFVVYPDGLSLMGKIAPLFSVLFFLMMLALGFGTELSAMETIMNAGIYIVKKFTEIKTNAKIILIRGIICVVYFLFGLCLVSRGGLYILDLLDSATTDFPFLLIGLLELICLPWIYGSKRLIADLESMVGPKPKWFKVLLIVFWNFVTPILILAILITNIISLKKSQLPWYAQMVYWLIALSPLYFFIAFAIKQIYQNKKKNGFVIWKELLKTDEMYYDNKILNLTGQNDGKKEHRIELNQVKKWSSSCIVTPVEN